jgi:hypothetical protein
MASICWSFVRRVNVPVWFAVAMPVTGSAQVPTVMLRTGVCAECALTLVRVATLGSAKDSISVGGLPVVTWNPARSEFLVTGLPFPMDRILRYDTAGVFRGSIGRSGDGPNEFRGIVHLATGPDSYTYVFAITGRMTVLSPEYSADRVLRLPPLATLLHAAVFESGEIVVASPSPVPDLVGIPLHRLDSEGSRIRSFGVANQRVQPDRPSQDRRLIHIANSGCLWAVRPDRYALERYDVDDQLVAEVVRNAPWFPDRDYEMSAPEEPASPFMRGLGTTASGHLFTVASVPALRAQSGMSGPVTPSHLRSRLDTVIEVIDWGGGAVQGSIRVDDPIVGVAGDDLIYSVREDEFGITLIDIWRIAFSGPGPEPGPASACR